MKKHGFFFTAFRVFNFLCLPPKGFFIDKALGSVGSAVEEKLPMERLAIGDRQGLVHRGDGSEETEEGQARRGPGVGVGMGRERPRVGRPRAEARLGRGREPGGSEQVAKPETSTPDQRFLQAETFRISWKR